MNDIAQRTPFQSVTYDLVVRLFGSIWFLLLSLFVGWGSIMDITTSPLSQLSSRLCLSAFYLTLWFLILTRPPAKSEANALLPRLAAFVGTYLPWSITFTTRGELAVPNLVSTALVISGTALMLITIWHLGRSFSLVPQARFVVQTGPYRWIRHPLYIAEEIAVLGVVLQFLSPLTVTILFAHIGVQICRIIYEEKLLDQALPEYRSYATSRWRLIPFIW